MTKTTKLEIALLISSLGEGLDGVQEKMTVEAFDENGASVRLIYEIDASGAESMTALSEAHNLSGVYSGLHLVQLVTTTLMNALGPDDELLHDVFASEDGERNKVLTIEVPTPNWAGM